MTFDNTKYSHLSDEELVRHTLYGHAPISELESSLALRLEDALATIDNLTESANLLSLALREYGVYADIEPKAVVN